MAPRSGLRSPARLIARYSRAALPPSLMCRPATGLRRARPAAVQLRHTDRSVLQPVPRRCASPASQTEQTAEQRQAAFPHQWAGILTVAVAQLTGTQRDIQIQATRHHLLPGISDGED